jgi:hypothetical protein
MKSDEDFLLLTDEAWEYLFKIYGGNDITRYSIEVSSDPTEEGGKTEKEFIIEVFYKKL